jgi:hypothetical protein
MSDSPGTRKPTAKEIEAEIAVTRAHLTSTVDELITRAQPKEILRRQGDSARTALVDATYTPDGELRSERVAGVLAALSVLLITVGLLRRRRSS